MQDVEDTLQAIRAAYYELYNFFTRYTLDFSNETIISFR